MMHRVVARRWLSQAAARAPNSKAAIRPIVSPSLKRDSADRWKLFAQPTIRELLQSSGRALNPAIADQNRINDDADSKNDNHEVTVSGWVRTKRKSKRVLFLEVADGSTNKGLQCVVDLDAGESVESSSPQSLETSSQLLETSKMTNGKNCELVKCANALNTGCAVRVRGHLVRSPAGAEQSLELRTTDLALVGDAKSDAYPLQKKRHSLEYLRNEQAHFRARSRLFSAVVSVRNRATMAAHEFFQMHDFKHIHTPLLTGHDCEGGGEVFQVVPQIQADQIERKTQQATIKPTAFFNAPAYLTVSAQLHLEMAAHSHSRVYTLSPCFRADPGSEESTRHLAEFYMLEAEWAWLGGVRELCAVSEQLVKHVLGRVLDGCAEDLQYLEQEVPKMLEMKHQKHKHEDGDERSLRQRLHDLCTPPYETLSYTDAFRIIQNAQTNKRHRFEHKLNEWGQPLQTEHERFLCRHVGEDRRGVFVVDYPAACKAFYMLPNSHDTEASHDSEISGETVACMDLLMPRLGEVVGGSMREWHHDRLLHKLRETFDREHPPTTSITTEEHEIKRAQFIKQHQWYLDLRRFGSCPHGGFGLGFDRLLMLCTGLENIRDVVQAGRWKSRLPY